MNFLSGLAAGVQGSQDYDLYQRKRQSDMQQQQIRQFEFDQAMQQAEMQRRQMQSAPEYANNLFNAMGRLPRRGPLSPPPMAQQQPTPQPGEASVPMTQGGPSQTQPPVPMPPSQSDPERAYLSGQPTDQDVETPQKALQRAMGDKQALTRDMMRYRNAGPDQKGIFYQEMKKIDSAIVRLSGQGGMVSAGGDVPQGVPPGGGMMKTGMQQGQPQAQPTSPPIAPYRSMDSVGQAAPQGPSLVPNPPPPPIPQGQPEPQRNSLSIQDAIEVIKGMNIKDPMMRMRVLEGMKPYLTEEARQEAAMLRGQHQQSQEELARMRYAESVRSHQANEGEKSRKDDQAGTWSFVMVDGKAMQMNSKTGEMRAAPGVNPDAKVDKIGPAAKPADTGSLSPDAIEFAAKQMLLTGQLPPMGMGKSAAAQRAQVLNRAAQLSASDGTTPSDVQGNKAELKAESSNLTKLTTFNGMVGQFESTAQKNMDLSLKLAKGGAGTNYPTINKWINAVQTGTGKGDIVAFRTALETAKTEFAKIMSGATGAAGITDSARREADQLFSVDMSPDQLEASIRTAKLDMKNRMSSLKDEMESARKAVRSVGKKPAGPGALPSGFTEDK